ncbi:hypothetical protein Hanom_Chr11g01031011 [Helianthus anomalus]
MVWTNGHNLWNIIVICVVDGVGRVALELIIDSIYNPTFVIEFSIIDLDAAQGFV